MLKIGKIQHNILFSTDWVDIKQVVCPEKNIHGYDYLYEKRCNGKIVVLFPFRTKNNRTEYLLRNEITPCWSVDSVVSSITGGFEKDKGIKGTAVMELEEEAGYEITQKDLIDLGTVRGTKSCDTIYCLFAVDLTGINKTTDAAGDGSELEQQANCEWMLNLDECEDPMAYVAYVRLQNSLQ